MSTPTTPLPAGTPTAIPRVGFFKRIENWVESLWKTEEPTLAAGFKAVEVAAIPILKTQLGQLALTTVSGLTAYAASNGGTAAAASALNTIVAGAKTAGVTIGKSEANMLIELSVQHLQTAAASLTATPTP